MTFIYLLISIESRVLNREPRKAVISHLRSGALSPAAFSPAIVELFIYSHDQHVDPAKAHLHITFKTTSLR
ncbi:hypothetical protein BCON_0114g00340 [Botryotinia convoluta]|uniref:Uncharacterized protein n=1 Tax=Botryotinia convoluta TaxID=54673 RepID=A0A4Z1HY61_9HELO|nr:hypothetical protein BCON_0114g00340 [Botryotinia convoluta]